MRYLQTMIQIMFGESFRMVFAKRLCAASLSHLFTCSQNEMRPPQVQGFRFLQGITTCKNYDEENKRGDNVLPPVSKILEGLNIHPNSYKLLGRNQKIICPKCKGGRSKVMSLSLYIGPRGDCALWKCHRTSCGWKGGSKIPPVSTHLSSQLDITDSESAEAKSKVKANKNLHGAESAIGTRDYALRKCHRASCGWKGGSKITPVSIHLSPQSDVTDSESVESKSKVKAKKNLHLAESEIGTSFHEGSTDARFARLTQRFQLVTEESVTPVDQEFSQHADLFKPVKLYTQLTHVMPEHSECVSHTRGLQKVRNYVAREPNSLVEERDRYKMECYRALSEIKQLQDELNRVLIELDQLRQNREQGITKRDQFQVQTTM